MMCLIHGISILIPSATVAIQLSMSKRVLKEFDSSLHLSGVSDIGQTAYFQEFLQHHMDGIVPCPNVYSDT